MDCARGALGRVAVQYEALLSPYSEPRTPLERSTGSCGKRSRRKGTSPTKRLPRSSSTSLSKTLCRRGHEPETGRPHCSLSRSTSATDYPSNVKLKKTCLHRKSNALPPYRVRNSGFTLLQFHDGSCGVESDTRLAYCHWDKARQCVSASPDGLRRRRIEVGSMQYWRR